MSKEIYWIDLPDPHDLSDESVLVNVQTCNTKAEAVAWIQKHIDPNCDEAGRINIISKGEDYE